jgi:Secretion system C-terminal sorting domain
LTTGFQQEEITFSTENMQCDYGFSFNNDCNDPPTSIELGRNIYTISTNVGSASFLYNANGCTFQGDLAIVYDYDDDTFYQGGTCTTAGTIPITSYIGYTNTFCLELYLTISNQDGNPYLEWNEYHDSNILGYNVYRKVTTSSGTTTLVEFTTATSYLDEEFEIDPKFGDDQVEYWIKAKISSTQESLEGNHVQIDGTSSIQWKTFSEKINNVIVNRINQNYPNPFNPSTQIKYSLAQDADVTLKVYDMLGTEVAKLVNETQTAGNHTINFNAQNLSSGIYIYRITASDNGRILFTDSKQMILLR